MITIHHERGNFWPRLKLLLTLGSATSRSNSTKPVTVKPTRRPHRTTTFFELP